MLKSVKIDEAARTITFVLDLEPPTPSASGKTLVIASTRGNATSDAKMNGQPVVVGINAYIRK